MKETPQELRGPMIESLGKPELEDRLILGIRDLNGVIPRTPAAGRKLNADVPGGTQRLAIGSLHVTEFEPNSSRLSF